MGDTFYPPQRQHRQTEMRVLATAVVLVSVASVAPAPQFSGLKSLVKSLTGEDKPGEVNGDYEQVPYEVLGKFNGYEERKYPSVMYACTEMTYDAPDDEDSEEWGLERAIEWMTNKKSWKDRPQSKMFMKLFRYIAGVNKDSQEIEMTVPLEQDGRQPGGRQDHQRHVLLHHQRIPVKPSRARGSRGEDSEEQGEGCLREAVRGL